MRHDGEPWAALGERISAIEADGGDGSLALPAGPLRLSNLAKAFWPDLKLTKGDVLRHYVRVAARILPRLSDRPLILRRQPDGARGAVFHQHRAPVRPPKGVATATVAIDSKATPMLVGGTLQTLLYCAQLGAIEQHPWLARVGSLDSPEEMIFDLDPGPGVAFERVREAALRVRDALAKIGIDGWPKTSGSRGLHILVKLAPGAGFTSAGLLARTVAAWIASRWPKLATIERAPARRNAPVYVDTLQNARGKSVAAAFSLRASAFAGVSMPVRWADVERGVKPEDHTLRSVSRALTERDDAWAGLAKARGIDLRVAVERLARTAARTPVTTAGRRRT